MSQSSQYNLTCPKCKTPHEATLYHSVNIAEDPDLRVQLLSGRLNAVTCPSCGLSYRVDKPVLYNDPERRIMIYLMPARLDQVPELEDQFLDMMKSVGNVVPDDDNAPHFHLVLSRSELVERVFVCEAGLDPRVLEYLKYSIYTRNMEKLPYEEKALLFNAQDSTDEDLFFVVQDIKTSKLQSVIHHSRKAYTALVEMFGKADKGTELFEMFPGPYISARALLLQEIDEALDLDEIPEDERLDGGSGGDPDNDDRE